MNHLEIVKGFLGVGKTTSTEKSKLIFSNSNLFGKLSRFQNAIKNAEEARVGQDFQYVHDAFKFWTTQWDGINELINLETDPEVKLALRQLFTVGYLGLIRIEHVSSNSEHYGNPNDTEIFIEKIGKSDNLFEMFNVDHSLPWTLTGDPIDWKGEIAQDKAASYLKQGNGAYARLILNSQLDVQVDSQDNSEDKDVVEARQAGRNWCRAVVMVKLGILNNNYHMIADGLDLAVDVNQDFSNPERLATLIGKNIQWLWNTRQFPFWFKVTEISFDLLTLLIESKYNWDLLSRTVNKAF